MFKYNHDCPFEAYITNLGKYNEGMLVGEWVKFPTTKKKFNQTLERIGINEEYQEWFVSDYDIYVDNIRNSLSPYSSFIELNDIAREIVDYSIK